MTKKKMTKPKFHTASKSKLGCTVLCIALSTLSVSPFQFHGSRSHITSLRNGHCPDRRCCLSTNSNRKQILDKGTNEHSRRQLKFNFSSPSPSPTELYSASTAREDDDKGSNSRPLGVLVLLTVPLAWGTYAPVVKYVYEMNPPVPGLVFSGGYYMLAAITLSLLSFLQYRFSSVSATTVPEKDNTIEEDSAEELNSITTENNNELSATATSDQLLATTSNSSSNRFPIQILGGMELGSYLFIGNFLQVIGLRTVPADRAAFLVQLTTIMVPLFQAAFAGDLAAIPVLTWVACILAFLGVVIMGLDAPEFQLSQMDSIFSSISDISYSSGDLLIVAAAVAYTMHVIRLGRYAKFTTPLDLAAAKASVEAVLSIGLLSLLLASGQSSISFVSDLSSEISTYFQTLNEQIALGQFPPSDSGKVVGAILWTGWITCAYTIYAQSFGQRRVSPTDANLIYSMQPLFTALFAFALLGESLGPTGYLGGSFIASALWIVTKGENNDKLSRKENILD